MLLAKACLRGNCKHQFSINQRVSFHGIEGHVDDQTWATRLAIRCPGIDSLVLRTPDWGNRPISFDTGLGGEKWGYRLDVADGLRLMPLTRQVNLPCWSDNTYSRFQFSPCVHDSNEYRQPQDKRKKAFSSSSTHVLYIHDSAMILVPRER